MSPKLPQQATDRPALRRRIEPLLHILPEFDYTARESGEVDFYGASDQIARQLGLPRAPFTPAGPTWIHGWSGATRTDVAKRPESMSDRLRPDQVCLVDHPRFEGFLHDAGYAKARAIGAPLTYADAGPVERIPGSVLVMPVHSSRYASFDGRNKRLPYVEECLQLRERFSVMAGCINAEDVTMGNWLHAFEVNDLPWVCGAWIFDRNALTRMQRILRSFEYVCTNSQGSHVAYAAYCGCKVFFFGENREYPLERLLQHPHLKANPQLAEDIRKNRPEQMRRFREDFPFFFVPPEAATTQIDWASEQLGVPHKIEAREIADIFGWKLRKTGKVFTVESPLSLRSAAELIDDVQRALKSNSGAEALLLTDELSSRQVKLQNLSLARARALLLKGDTAGANEAVALELQDFPGNTQAQQLAAQLHNKVMTLPASPLRSVMTAGGNAPHPFLNPSLEPNNCDLYWVRQSILRAVQDALPLFHGTFLDIGCGVMPYRSLITQAPSQVTKYLGLDIETDIYRADVDLRWDGKSIPLPEASVDSAMATEVLEHCPEPVVVLKEARRVLKPGGTFFFTVPFVWPLHDAPYDYYRYTPFAIKRMLEEAGFTDIKLGAMGGWNASLAQMMGLWLKRAPLAPEVRNKMARQLYPIYEELVKTDTLPTDPLAGNTMSTGWTGTAKVPSTTHEKNAAWTAGRTPVVLVRSHEFNYSETFIEDHVNHLSSELTLLYGCPFPRFVKGGKSVLPEAAEARLKEAIVKNALTPAIWNEYTEGVASFLRASKGSAVLLESGLMGAFVHEACSAAGLPFVVHFHGVDAFGQELLSQWGAHYRKFFQSAASVVAVSRAMHAQLLTLGAPADKTLLAPYGVAVDLPQLSHPADSAPQFVAVGRFVEKKAPFATLQAFTHVVRECPEARLVMIGDGPLFAACKALAAKNGISSAVTFLGAQTRDVVSRVMASSRVFVQHSITAANGDSEGLPLAVLEAGAHGLPVVSTRHAGIPDAVRHDVDGFLVAEKDIGGMAEAMLRLAQDPALAARLGTAFRERVVAQYSRQGSLDRLHAILAAAADRRSAAALGVTLDTVEPVVGLATDAVKPAPAAMPSTPPPSKGPAQAAAPASSDPRDLIAADRNHLSGYLTLGQSARERGDLAEAYRAFGEAQRLAPSDETRAILQQLEDEGALGEPDVEAYRRRAGWLPRRKPAKQRRILVVTNLLPPQEMGGFGRTMFEFGRDLLARGHSVRVLTSDMPHLERKPSAEHAAFAPQVRRTLKLIGDWKDGPVLVDSNPERLKAILRQNRQVILDEVRTFKPEVIVAGNLDLLGHHFLQEVLDARIPVLHRLGNAQPGYEVHEAPSSPLYCIASCSEWVNDQLRAKMYPVSRYAVLPPGSPLTDYFRSFAPRRDKLRIAFASLLMPYKGAHVLVEALAYLKRVGIEFECTLAGDSTSPSYLDKLKLFATEQGFADKLTFPGFLGRAELAALFARSNTLVFPSIFEEPFGKTQIEGMAAGLLVVSSGNGGGKEIIRDGETGLFFKSGDARSLAEKLARTAREPAWAAQIAESGQADAFRFTTAASVDRLEALIEESLTLARSQTPALAAR